MTVELAFFVVVVALVVGGVVGRLTGRPLPKKFGEAEAEKADTYLEKLPEGVRDQVGLTVPALFAAVGVPVTLDEEVGDHVKRLEKENRERGVEIEANGKEIARLSTENQTLIGKIRVANVEAAGVKGRMHRYLGK